MSGIKLGKYKHYKGNFYEVLGTATHSETMEQMVVYKTLYGNFDLWVRPADMFSETIEVNGHMVPRFAKVEDSTQDE